MAAIILQINCLLILSVYLIFAEPLYPGHGSWSNQYLSSKKFGEPATNYDDTQQQITDFRQMAPNQYLNLDTFDGPATNDLDRQQQKLVNKRQAEPHPYTNSDNFDKSSADYTNNNEFNSKELRNIFSKKNVNHFKKGRGKKKGLKSDSEYFYTLNTDQQNKINNTFFMPYNKHFRKNVLKNVLIFSNELHAVISEKTLNFVAKLLGAQHDGKVNNDDADSRNFELYSFLASITNPNNQKYALKHPDQILTLDY